MLLYGYHAILLILILIGFNEGRSLLYLNTSLAKHGGFSLVLINICLQYHTDYSVLYKQLFTKPFCET